MSDTRFSASDYPLTDKHPDRVTGQHGKTLEQLTVEAAVDGQLDMDDLRITPQALLAQAQIARSVGRVTLAENFERAAEMTRLPQSEVMRIYELLRPGRAPSADALRSAAHQLRRDFDATRLAAFLEEAALIYQRRGLFRKRF